MKLKDIKLSDYFSLSNSTQYDIWFEMIEPNPVLNGIKSRGLNDYTFNEVAFIRKKINEFSLDSIKEIYKICFNHKKNTKFVVSKVWTFELLAWWKYVIEQIDTVVAYEQGLENEPDPIALQAGIDKMNRFEYLNTKIPIAEQFGVTPFEVGEWKWIDVFLFMSYNNTKAHIDRRYTEIKSKKK